MIAFALTLSLNLTSLLSLWGDSMQLSVYFKDSATQENIQTVTTYLESQNKFTYAKYISKTEALNSFKDQIANYAPDLLKDPELNNLIPASLQLGIRKEIDLKEHIPLLQNTAQLVKTLSGVDDVTFGQDWIKNYSSFLGVVQYCGGVFILILLGSSLFVMLNSISTSIHQRKHEIEVLELVGASPSYIRSPFLIEGSATGFCASTVALLLTNFLWHALKNYLQVHASFLQVAEHLHVLSLSNSMLFLCAGVCLGSLSSWLSIRKINTGWAASGVAH